MHTITPFLWFDGNLEEIVAFYTSIFEDTRVHSVSPMMAVFELQGQKLMALNGGPKFQFTEAFSLFIECETQEEVDSYWSKLLAGGGVEQMCGWLKDKHGLSWQVIPKTLMRYLSDPDRAKAERVTQAMLQMKKIDIAVLEAAAAGRAVV